jgi:hypothetical protein
MDDKTKWIRLIQWKFGGCGVYESVQLPGKIDAGYVRLFPGEPSKEITEGVYRETL